jgi:hypothetical protein
LNLKPKIEYLTEMMGNDVAVLKAAVLKQPTLLGYSLDKRIRPRMEQIINADVDPRAITVGIPMKDAAFQLWLNGRRIKSLAAARSVSKLLEQSKADASAAVLDDEEKGGGRVVHWTRDRKQPSTAGEIS